MRSAARLKVWHLSPKACSVVVNRLHKSSSKPLPWSMMGYRARAPRQRQGRSHKAALPQADALGIPQEMGYILSRRTGSPLARHGWSGWTGDPISPTESAAPSAPIRQREYIGLDSAGNTVRFESSVEHPLPARTERLSEGPRLSSDAHPGAPSDILRQRDYIRIGEVPPPPAGFTLVEPQLRRSWPMDQRDSAEDIANLARDLQPDDVRPLPCSRKEDLSAVERANPGSLRLLEAPDE